MFKRFSRRILLITLVSVSAFATASGLFSYYWAKRTVLSEFVSVSSNYFQTSRELLEQYLNSTGETAKVIANNPNLAVAARGPNAYGEVPRLLDVLASGMNPDIRGIALYAADGTVYSLSRMSNLPSLKQMMAEEPVRRFLEDGKRQSAWISRYRDLSSYYDYRYVENGTFSFLLKTGQGGESGVPGTMVVDLDAVQLFRFFASDHPFFAGNRLYLVRDGTDIVPSASGSEASPFAEDDLRRVNGGTGGRFTSEDGSRLVLYETILESNAKIVAAIPLQSSYAHLSPLGRTVLLLGLLSGAFALALAFWLRAGIVRPLSQLYERMKSFR